MAYNLAAKAIRRCKATRTDGQRCRAWAMWNKRVCVAHSDRKKSGPHPAIPRYVTKPHYRHAPCRCDAYQWPHRPGGGLCNWPFDPVEKCPTPPGTKAG